MADSDQFVVSIKLGDNIDIPISFCEGDIVEDVAYQFCKDHRLSVSYYDKIAQFLRDKLVEVRSGAGDTKHQDVAQAEDGQARQRDRRERREQEDTQPEVNVNQYYSFGKPEGGSPPPEPEVQVQQYYSEEYSRVCQPVLRYKNRNNDVLKYFNANAENNLSTDRFLVEDLCKSINDSLDHKLKRAPVAEESEDDKEYAQRQPGGLKAQVHDRLYRDAKFRAAKKQRSSSNPRHNKSMGDYQREYVSVTDQVRYKKEADTYTSSKERQRSNSGDRNRGNPFSTGKKSSYMNGRHNRTASYNSPGGEFEIHTIDQIYRSRDLRVPSNRKTSQGPIPRDNDIPTNLFLSRTRNKPASRRNSGTRQGGEKSIEIQRCDQLHAMSKLMEERAQARKKLLEDRYTFRPSVNQYQSEKTAMSFDERLGLDLRERKEKSRQREEVKSRDNLRKTMHPNTGRHPIVRRVTLDNSENRDSIHQSLRNGREVRGIKKADEGAESNTKRNSSKQSKIN